MQAPAYGTMSRWIGRMRRRALGEGLRQEIIPVSVEATLHGLGIENIRVRVGLDSSAMAGQNLSNESAARLGAMAHVDHTIFGTTRR